MNFFIIFSVFLMLSSYCMIMWHHSSNFMDTVLLKQQYEQKYYLCAALLDYAILFYKQESSQLKDTDFRLLTKWPDQNSGYSGKISWARSDKQVIIEAELINKNKSNKTEFTMKHVLDLF